MKQKEIEIADFEYISDKIDLKDISNSKFLITGASGFIANYLIKFLLYFNEIYSGQKCIVYALCRDSKKLLEKLKEYETDNLIIIEQDVTNPIRLEDSVDYIVHAASISSTKYFDDYAVEVLCANSIGTYHILEYAKKHKNLIKKVLFCSSGAVYGEIEDHVRLIKEDNYFNLDFTDVKNCYSEGKRFGEILQKAYWKEYRIPTNSVRISHTYGPGIDLEDGHIYSEYVRSILNKKDIILKTAGNAVRPFCYIADALTAFIIILQKGNMGESYNMANVSCTYTIYELANLLLRQFQLDNCMKVIRHDSNYKQTENKILMDCGKLQKLGWNPEVNAVDGFGRTISYYQTKGE